MGPNSVDSAASGHKLGVKHVRVLEFLFGPLSSDDSTCHILNSNGCNGYLYQRRFYLQIHLRSSLVHDVSRLTRSRI